MKNRRFITGDKVYYFSKDGYKVFAYFVKYIFRYESVKVTDCRLSWQDPNDEEFCFSYEHHSNQLNHDLSRKILTELHERKV